MDLGYSTSRASRPLPPSLARVSARAAAFLAGGGRAAVLSGPSGAGKAAVMEQLLAGMPGRVLRVRNAGSGSGSGGLDLAAVLQQLGQAPAEAGDEQGAFFRTLAEMAYDDYSAVLAIEDAHTLTGFALSALSRVPGLGGPDLPGIILLLSGEPALLAKLMAPGLELLRNPRRTLLLKLESVTQELATQALVTQDLGQRGSPEPVEALPAGMAGPGMHPRVRVPRPWFGRELRVAAVAAVAGGLATAGALAWPSARRPAVDTESAALVVAVASATPAAVEAAAAEPMAVEPVVVAARPADPAGPALPPDQQLRHEFDGFLDRAGRDTARLTPAARQVLFEQYLRWQGRKLPGHAARP